jgi:hypothetical protein
MEFELVEGLVVREEERIVQARLCPKRSRYKFPEEVQVPVVRRQFFVVADSIEEKLRKCKEICRKGRSSRVQKNFMYFETLPRNVRDISARTDHLVSTLEKVSETFSILSSSKNPKLKNYSYY